MQRLRPEAVGQPGRIDCVQRPLATMAAATLPGEEVYAFRGEYLDPSNMLKSLHIAWHAKDSTVEIYDPHARRVFLKRTIPAESISIDDFAIGNTVTIMSRAYKIVEFLNAVTRARFSTLRTTTIAVIKPDGLAHMGRLLTMLQEAGFAITNATLIKLDLSEAEHFYEPIRAGTDFAARAAHLSRDAVLAVALAAENCVARLHAVAGPADPADALDAAPTSIRCVHRSYWLRKIVAPTPLLT